MQYHISAILPTYNEKENIGKLISQIKKYAGVHLYEIIVVDDNSPDRTWEIVTSLAKKDRRIRLIRRIRVRGLPSAIWAGIKAARGNVVMWMDCDLSHPPKLIKEMLKYASEYDVVSASRYVKGGKDKRGFLRILTSRTLNLFGSVALNIHVKDLTSGFYLVKKEVFRKIRLKDHGYAEYCIRFAYESVKSGFKWKEVPYIFKDREEGTSKSYMNIRNFLKNGYLCVREIIKLRFS